MTGAHDVAHECTRPRGGDAATGECSGRRLPWEELKKVCPRMIVRFPEDCRLARLDRWLSLQLMSIPWGPLASLVFVCAHVFTSPWNGLCTIPLVVLALGASWPHSLLILLAVALTVLPMLLLVKGRLDKSFFFGGNHIFLGMLGVMLFVWVLDARSFQASCLYYSSWAYTSLLTYLLKCFTGRRRPALIMRDNVAKLPRMPLWVPVITPHGIGDNAYHSFPSGDAVAVGCFAGAIHAGLGEVHWLAAAFAVLAVYGRIYIFAHHLSDVLAGLALGLSCTLAFAACASPQGYHVLLAWNVACVCIIMALVAAGPLRTLRLTVVLLPLLRLSIGTCLSMLGFYVLVGLFTYGLFLKTSFDHKPWVVKHMEEFFTGVHAQEKALPPYLHATLEEKRAELRRRAADPKGLFPSNVYSIYAYAPGGGVRSKAKPFAADWEDVAQLMSARLEDFSRQTGLDLHKVDVVLGIYTGGALLAPLVAGMLGCGTCFIRINRYSDDVLGYSGSIRTMAQKVTGRHEELYRTSDPPDKSLLRDKIILMVDDAVGTGGTFRAAYRFCMQAGAREARGVALDTITPGRHIWDPNLPRAAPQHLCVPCFLPWGLR